MSTRWKGRMAGAARTVGLVLTMVTVLIVSATATITVTGAALSEAIWAVGLGASWGGLTFACGWWSATRGREHVAAEVAVVLAPVLKELKHLRGALAQRGNVDEHAKTSVHPRRRAPASDDAKTMVGPVDELLQAVR